LVITIWYDAAASVSIDEEARQSLSEDMSTEFESAAGFDTPERNSKLTKVGRSIELRLLGGTDLNQGVAGQNP
jgi:hypothetical protein